MARKSKSPLGAKAAFVRANPAGTAQELVKLAKAQGLGLTVGHVYNIRSNDKKKQGAVDPAGSAPAASRSERSSAESPLDAQLRTLVIRIGLDRAERVFTELKSTLSRMS
jgi:hypothetical protein